MGQRQAWQQMMQQRRQQERSFAQPRQNWGQIRREQAFEAKRQRDALKAERRADKDYWKYAQRQQQYGQYDNYAYRQPENYRGDYYQRDQYNRDQYNRDQYQGYQYRSDVQPYYYTARPDVWFGDDYSDYDRYSRYTVYTPVYPSYDYGYNSYPVFGTYAYNDRYYYGDSDGFDWKSLLFRSLISAFFSNGDNVGYVDPYPQYASYVDNRYYGYIPEYRYQPPYYTFGYAPTYAYYEPAAYYGYDQYSNGGIPYDYIADGSLPYDDMVEIYSGGISAEIIQRALGTGYYQGILEGQAARQRGWGDRYYYDPYVYEQTIYDPYSSSMGDCRRYLSEGYEMGYQDALAGRDEFDLAREGGDIDLVSMLLGSVLSLRG